jgi:hypothetical protein
VAQRLLLGSPVWPYPGAISEDPQHGLCPLQEDRREIEAKAKRFRALGFCVNGDKVSQDVIQEEFKRTLGVEKFEPIVCIELARLTTRPLARRVVSFAHALLSACLVDKQ